MNIEELESVVDAMAEEGGDMIDALYDTVTLQKDTYNGFVCRLREVVRLAKNEQKKSVPVGDMAAIRDALANLVDVIDRCDSGSPLWWHSGAKGVKPLEDAKAALAKPPRQCDVGTPSEQADRHRELCLKHGGCSTCPRNKDEWSYKDCILDWAQMPFKKEGVAK